MERFMFWILVAAVVSLAIFAVHQVSVEQQMEDRFTAERDAFKSHLERAERGQEQLKEQMRSLRSENTKLKKQLAAESNGASRPKRKSLKGSGNEY